MGIGVLAPTGYWDPAGFMKQSVDEDGWEWKDEATFRKYRTAELKHGRLAMVALTGMITASFTRFADPIFESSRDGWAVADSEAAGAIGIIFLAAGFVEVENGDGDFNDPLQWQAKTNGAFGDFDELRNKELAHGRLAMSTVFTLWLSEYLTNYTPQFFLTQQASPSAVLAIIALLLVWIPYTQKESTALVTQGTSKDAMTAA